MGGAVLPKLTWSAPKDAVWMTSGNTMRCSTSDEVVLLLKSSDRVAHDISEALQQLQLQESEKSEEKGGSRLPLPQPFLDPKWTNAMWKMAVNVKVNLS